jgi:hypothetical protein
MSEANFDEEDQTVLSQDAGTPLPGDEEGALDAPAGEFPILLCCYVLETTKPFHPAS